MSAAADSRIARVAIAPDGDVVVAGDFTGTMSLDGAATNMPTTLKATGRDAFVARYDACGTLLWARSSSGTGDEVAEDVVVLDGDAVFAGTATKTFGFGSDLATTGNLLRGALVRLGDLGATTWARDIGALGDGELRLASDGEALLYVGGGVAGALALDPTLTSKGKREVFLARLDPAGKVTWARRWGGAADEQLTALGIAGSEAWLAGFYTTGMSFGGAPLPEFQGLPLGFFVRVDATGNVLTSVKSGERALIQPAVVARATDGSAWIAGSAVGSVAMMLDDYAYALQLDATSGKVLGEAVLGETVAGSQSARGLVALPNGRVLMAGTLVGTVPVGDSSYTAGVGDVYLAELATSAKVVAVAKYGGSLKAQFGDALARGPQGELAVAGRYEGILDFPGAAIDAGGAGLYVSRLLGVP